MNRQFINLFATMYKVDYFLGSQSVKVSFRPELGIGQDFSCCAKYDVIVLALHNIEFGKSSY